MKIMRFIKDGKENTGLLEDNSVTELSCTAIEAINSPNIDKFKK